MLSMSRPTTSQIRQSSPAIHSSNAQSPDLRWIARVPFLTSRIACSLPSSANRRAHQPIGGRDASSAVARWTHDRGKPMESSRADRRSKQSVRSRGMKTLALAGIGVLAQGLAFASQANAEQKQFGHTVQCRKNDTGGCTGDTANCYRAPSDYVIMRSSVQAGPVKVDCKSPRCIISYGTSKPLMLQPKMECR